MVKQVIISLLTTPPLFSFFCFGSVPQLNKCKKGGGWLKPKESVRGHRYA